MEETKEETIVEVEKTKEEENEDEDEGEEEEVMVDLVEEEMVKEE